MTKEKNEGEDIEKVRRQELGVAGAAKREAAEKRRILRLFSEKALKAKKARDARAYAEQLRLLKIAEDSPEWKNAWDFSIRTNFDSLNPFYRSVLFFLREL